MVQTKGIGKKRKTKASSATLSVSTTETSRNFQRTYSIQSILPLALQPYNLDPLTTKKNDKPSVKIEEEPISKSSVPSDTSDTRSSNSSSSKSDSNSSSSFTDEYDFDMVFVDKVVDDIMKENTVEPHVTIALAIKRCIKWLQRRMLLLCFLEELRPK